MKSGRIIFRIFAMLGIIFLQIFMTQIVTLLFSFFLREAETYPTNHPVPFVIFLGLTYTTAIFGVGWLALQFDWFRAAHSLLSRLVATLAGAYLPLIAALFVFPSLEPGNPAFFIAILTGILGFYLPGLRTGESPAPQAGAPR